MASAISFIGAFGLGAVVRAGVVLVLCLLFAGCKEDILSSLDQRDALEAQLVLSQAGISADITPAKDGYGLSVEARERDNALAILADAGLPRARHQSIAELFPGNGFLVTPYEQKARMAYAIEQELAQTLSDLDGVADARVHVVLAEDNGRGLIRERARASTLMQYRPGSDPVALENSARALLLNSVRALAYEDVSVVLVPWTAGAPERLLSDETVRTGQKSLIQDSGLIAWGRHLMIAVASLLAIAACYLLLVPNRHES